MKTAVLYLRVSSAGQVNTDYDPEGISIPAQRAACIRKAEAMGVDVVGEYVEPGVSGTNMEKRPAFQQMLQRLRAERDANYVIVYNLSRLNRNRIDDAKVLMMMRSMNVTLISAQENIDETPAGQLMHGILAAFNEYRSTADGADIRYKMGQKAKTGGTLGKAPIGYLNARDQSTGHEVRMVKIDEERAPFVKMAFELYATGNYSMEQVATIVSDRGLRQRPTARYPARVLGKSHVQRILRDPYYVGLVTYAGEDFAGRHQPIVSPELFAAVQREIGTRAAAGERNRRWPHYLKGTVWCAACHDRGAESRMTVQRSIGKGGGEFFYFFCAARQRLNCRSPYLAFETVESAVLDYYQSMTLPPGFASTVRTKLNETLADADATARLMRASLTERVQRLDGQEGRLLDLVAEGGMKLDKARERIKGHPIGAGVAYRRAQPGYF